MNRHVTIITLAALIIIIPVLGFPGSWKSFFSIILALIIGIISYLLYKEEVARRPKPKTEPKSTTYVDNLNEETRRG